MELYQLEQFVTLAQTCNMHLASEQLHITQPALSKNLKKLESELDCQLFERNRNKLELNAYGKILLKHSQEIFASVKDAKDEIRAEQEKNSAFISCSGYAIAALYFILPQIAHALPEKIFICSIKDVTDYHRLFQTGHADFIISDRKYDETQYENISLFEEKLLITVPSDLAMENTAELSPEQLKTIQQFILPKTPGYMEWFTEVLEKADVNKEKLQYIPIDKYLNSKSEFQACNLCSSLIAHFVPEIAGKKVFSLKAADAQRTLYAVFRRQDVSKLDPLISYLKSEKNNLFSNVSFLPYFMFRNESSNLIFK